MNSKRNRRGVYGMRMMPLMQAMEGLHQNGAGVANIRLGKLIGQAGFYFFLLKGLLWLLVPLMVYVLGVE